jgi:hypothetical protein
MGNDFRAALSAQPGHAYHPGRIVSGLLTGFAKTVYQRGEAQLNRTIVAQLSRTETLRLLP